MNQQVNRSLIPALLFGAVFVVFLNAAFAVGSVRELLNNERLVQHTWQVIEQLELILSSAKDAETGARGYLITGQESYLQPYTTARQDLPNEINQFARLTIDNPVQVENAEQIRASVVQRLLLLDKVIGLLRAPHSNSSQILRLSDS